jgi:MFS family permease
MSSITCTETVQPLAKLPGTLKGETSDSTLLNARPISPLVIARDEDESHAPTKPKTVVLITVCATGLNALLASLVIITFPAIATDLRLGPELLLWYVHLRFGRCQANSTRPTSVYSLTCGCTLLLLGSIADAVGSRLIYLAGCLLQTAFTLACGLSQTGAQIIIFRAFGGIASSFLLPTTVSIVSETFPNGKQRNMAFALLGGSQPVGFSVGLLLGGLLPNWRWGFYLASIISGIIFALAFWALPLGQQKRPDLWAHLKYQIDWIGIAIGSASVGLLSYAFT